MRNFSTIFVLVTISYRKNGYKNLCCMHSRFHDYLERIRKKLTFGLTEKKKRGKQENMTKFQKL